MPFSLKDVFLVIFLAILSFSAFADEDFLKDYHKVEDLIIEGDYKKAFRKSEKLFSGEIPQEMKAQLHFQKARILEALCRYELFHEEMKKGLSIVSSATGSASPGYLARTFYDAGRAWHFASWFEKAASSYEKALSYAEAPEVTDRFLLISIREDLAAVYTELAFHKKAEELFVPVLYYYNSRLRKKDTITDREGAIKIVRVRRKEKIRRRRAYSMALSRYSFLKIKSGEYQQADSILLFNEEWTKLDLRKRDIAYVECLYNIGLLNEARDFGSMAAYAYRKAQKFSGKSRKIRYKPVSRRGIEIQEKVILNYLLAGKRAKARKYTKILSGKVKRYYGKQGYPYMKVKSLEAQRLIIKENMDKAQKKLEELAGEKDILPENHPERIWSLMLLFDMYLENDQYLKAETTMKRLLAIKSQLYGTGAPEYHFTLMDFAAYHVLFSNRFSAAGEIYDTSLVKVIKPNINHRYPLYQQYLIEHAHFYEVTDQYEKARTVLLSAYQECKDLFPKDKLKQAEMMEAIASIQICLGKYGQADTLLQEAIRIYEDLGVKYTYFEQAQALQTLARLYIVQGYFADAEDALDRSFKLIRRYDKDENLKTSEAVEELAEVYIEFGKYRETEASLLESLQIKEEKFGTVHRSLISTLNHLSSLYNLTGDYSSSEKFALRAVEISKILFGKNSVKYAESLKMLQKTYVSIGDLSRAEEIAEEVIKIEIAQFGKNHIQVASSYNDLAFIHFLKKEEFSGIDRLFTDALEIVRENLGYENPRYAEILKNMAMVYLEMGKEAMAERLLDEANEIWVKKTGETNIHSAEIYYLKGNAASILEKFEEAREYYTVSSNIYASLFGKQHPDYEQALSKAGQMSYILEDYRMAVKNLEEANVLNLAFVDSYFPSLSERQKNRFWMKLSNDFEFYSSMAVSLAGEKPELLETLYFNAVQTKGLLLNSSIKVKNAILGSGDEALIAKYHEWVAKKEFLTAVISMSSEQKNANEVDQKSLEKEVEMLEKELSERSVYFASTYGKKEKVDWKAVRDGLKENEVAVEIIRFRHFDRKFTDSVIYAALIVSPLTKKHPDLVLLPNGHDLETRFLNYYRNCMKLKIPDRHSYDQFWKPVKEKIPDSAVVFLSPDGVFNEINIETLRREDGNYVLEKNLIVILNNTRELVAVRNKSEQTADSRGAAYFIANPQFHPDEADKVTVSPLPGAEEEARIVYKLLKSKGQKAELFAGEEASEELVKNLKHPWILHIASHGFFMPDMKDLGYDKIDGIYENRAIPDPLLRCGILLKNGGELINSKNVYEFNRTDGVLTAAEVMNLHLDDIELVVLSACETGRGQIKSGEGVYGLQRAFLVAGAHNIVMSLFKVNDQITIELISAFYRYWIETGDKRKALVRAKLDLMKKYKDPLSWGAFVMIGM